MQKALIAGIAVALICSFMGTFLVLRRYALFGDGIAHVAFGGVSVGLFLGVFPLWTAFAVSIFGALGLQKLRQSTKISGDAAVAVVLVSGLAIGVILVSTSGGFSVDLFWLFVWKHFADQQRRHHNDSWNQCRHYCCTSCFTKTIFQMTFDEEQAKIAGLPVTLLNYAFVVLASVTVVTSMRLVGILLISALIVLPNITAMMISILLARQPVLSSHQYRNPGR